jgi:CDGSH-type Zn-finger protein
VQTHPLQQEAVMKVTAMENGPNKLEGLSSYRVRRDGEEEVVERAVVFLCRCGHSENKPFCDGTHNKIGFESPGVEVDLALSPS